MAAKLIIAPEAQQDVDEAYCWYEDRRPGLGEEFLSCLDACIQGICRTPDLYPVDHEEFRRALVRRFPTFFYECTFEQVTVYSIFHTSQNPKKWHSRLM
ncbi:MAG: type II toxin-antitoxin system RelE/ParE family toxin [Proteobacteria bacterium]|nr:type II toxin-antitoxin system RelE/ParE family toxin [Pseudomonadota bacterium]MBU1689022.1 type II toxin-antitoxin system RelE/ParE family toxin [Pseudomonadota bacterium]